MYLYFDKNGVLKEIINDEYIRLGNNNVNTIYAYFEDEPNDITSVTGTIKYPDNTTSNEYVFTTTITQTIPYNKNADYKYFKDFTNYKFYMLPLSYPDGDNPPINLINQSGLYQVTIKAYTSNQVYANGLVTFNVEDGVVLEDSKITQSQYEYLMQLVGNCVKKIVSGFIEGLPRTSKIENNGNEIVLTQLNNIGLAGVKLRLKGSRLYFVRTMTNQQTHVEHESAIAEINDLGYVTILENGQPLFTINETGIYYRGGKVATYGDNSITTSMLQNNSVTYDKLSSTLQGLVNRFQTTSTKTIISPDGSNASDYVYEFTTTGLKITYTPSNTVILQVDENGIKTNALSINGTDIENALSDINASISTFNTIIPDGTNINNKLLNIYQADDNYAPKSLVNRVSTIEGKIPSEASSSNKLADKNYVNDQINSVSAYYITKNASGEAFDSYSQLVNATNYYSGGTLRTPTRNDYAIVLSDSTHDNACTRYSYQGNQWEYQYTVNESPMTQSQLDALNSGITAQKRANYDGMFANFNAIALDNSLTTGTLSEAQKNKLTGALNIILRGDKRYYCIGRINGEYKFVSEITQDSFNKSKLQRDVITINSSTGVWTYTANVEVAECVDYETLQTDYINVFYCNKDQVLTSEDIASLNDTTVVYYDNDRYTFYKENPMTYINTTKRYRSKITPQLISVRNAGNPFTYSELLHYRSDWLGVDVQDEVIEAINQQLSTDYLRQELLSVADIQSGEHIYLAWQLPFPNRSQHKRRYARDFYGTRTVAHGLGLEIEPSLITLETTGKHFLSIQEIISKIFNNNFRRATDTEKILVENYITNTGKYLFSTEFNDVSYFVYEGIHKLVRNDQDDDWEYEEDDVFFNWDVLEHEYRGYTMRGAIYSHYTSGFLHPSVTNEPNLWTFPELAGLRANILIGKVTSEQKSILDKYDHNGQSNNFSSVKADFGEYYISFVGYTWGIQSTEVEDNITKKYLTPYIMLIPVIKRFRR